MPDENKEEFQLKIWLIIERVSLKKRIQSNSTVFDTI